MDSYIQSSKNNSLLDFEDKILSIPIDQKSIMIVHDINRRPIINEEDEEYDYDVSVPLKQFMLFLLWLGS